jgi:hypothetical protein
MPSIPLDDPLLTAISIGVPVGLGIWLAWVHRDWPTTTKTTGFAAAAAGALAGAWLGFHATTGLLAFITAIIAATAGANLALLALDIARDQQIHNRFPKPAQHRHWRRTTPPANAHQALARQAPPDGNASPNTVTSTRSCGPRSAGPGVPGDEPLPAQSRRLWQALQVVEFRNLLRCDPEWRVHGATRLLCVPALCVPACVAGRLSVVLTTARNRSRA